MLPFLEAVQPELERVNQTILKRLYSEEPLVEDIGNHLINAGGKRLRPILVLMCARALGYSGDKHYELAAVIEFIHSATLLHDDVVDVSELRRGRPTANAKWGNAPSVLVGDFLYSRAFQMMVAVGSMDIMNTLSNTTNTIAEGEVQQLANARKSDLSEEAYRKVIYKKTAALFEAACECGASVAADENAEVDAYRNSLKQFGYHLGLAFQLMDDLLDYDGDAEALGKNVGDDLAEGKSTLPVIYALAHSGEADAQLIREAISSADLSKLDDIIKLVKQSGGLDYTRRAACHHAEQAIEHLQQVPESNWRQSLIELTRFAVERAY
ncbi:polyprenyl synthetase family protein [Agaribacterium haliotis]|uniref:polyprenyl synthetase family protein n=1 Tax=Agaribacterium haliotis TaxID=2013869 RepID=UPI000BB545CD|nr:polyprenyl synthetase family protein [Agaribacterium haliotis]